MLIILTFGQIGRCLREFVYSIVITGALLISHSAASLAATRFSARSDAEAPTAADASCAAERSCNLGDSHWSLDISTGK